MLQFTSSGSELKPNTDKTYKIVFNKEINYCEEILDIFDSIKDILNSNFWVENDQDELRIIMNHSTNIVTEEVDLVLLYLGSIHYDCDINIYSNQTNYDVRVADGKVKYYRSGLNGTIH